MRQLGFSALVLSATAACTLPGSSSIVAPAGHHCWDIGPQGAFLQDAGDQDRQYASRACQTALERNADNQATSWYVPGSRTLGRVTPVASYQIDDRTICREYAVTIGVADGAAKRVAATTGTACRQSDGTWWAWPVPIPEELRRSQTAANYGSP